MQGDCKNSVTGDQARS